MIYFMQFYHFFFRNEIVCFYHFLYRFSVLLLMRMLDFVMGFKLTQVLSTFSILLDSLILTLSHVVVQHSTTNGKFLFIVNFSFFPHYVSSLLYDPFLTVDTCPSLSILFSPSGQGGYEYWFLWVVLWRYWLKEVPSEWIKISIDTFNVSNLFNYFTI